MIGLLVGRMVKWLVGWMVGCQVSWLAMNSMEHFHLLSSIQCYSDNLSPENGWHLSVLDYCRDLSPKYVPKYHLMGTVLQNSPSPLHIQILTGHERLVLELHICEEVHQNMTR